MLVSSATAYFQHCLYTNKDAPSDKLLYTHQVAEPRMGVSIGRADYNDALVAARVYIDPRHGLYTTFTDADDHW